MMTGKEVVQGYSANLCSYVDWRGGVISFTFKHKKREILLFNIDWSSESDKCTTCRIFNNDKYTSIAFEVEPKAFITQNEAINYCKSLIREIKKI